MQYALLIDSHVHVHPCFDLGRLLHAAVDNLSAAAKGLDLKRGNWGGCLLLTEAGAECAYSDLVAGRRSLPAGWTLLQTEDSAAVELAAPSGARVLLINGRQIATNQGVEVLSLGTDDVVPDGLPMQPTLERVASSGAFPVIPWGFGKWWLSRGELVRRQLAGFVPGTLALGDNGGRLSTAPRPPLFVEAERQGFTVLPGSDPFPFPGQEVRVGTYGFMLERWNQTPHPATELQQRLRSLTASPRSFGHLANPMSFALSQVRMQLHMRAAKRTAA